MRKSVFTIVSFFVFSLMAIVGADAYTLNPSSGDLAPSTTHTIGIVANPPATGVVALQIRLTLSGDAVITGYTPPSGAGWDSGAIGTCAGATAYTSTQVCVDLVKGTDIVVGESLGAISVRTNESGTFMITRDSDNGYIVSDELEPLMGQSASYTISDTGVTVLPDTAITSEPVFLIIIGAMMFVTVGMLVYFIYPAFTRKNLS